MTRVKVKQRKARRPNPAAQAVRSPAYRPRQVASKKTYSRRIRRGSVDEADD
jgi:hypothetical protein